MRFKKLYDTPTLGFTTVQLGRYIGHRLFRIDVCVPPGEYRDFSAHRLRNARQYLREFELPDVAKKVVDILNKKM